MLTITHTHEAGARAEGITRGHGFAYIRKSCGGPSPVGGGYVLINSTPANELAGTDRIVCDCGQSVDPAPWAALNVAVTQMLGLYSSESRAAEAAREFGACSFHYQLSATEAAAMLTTLPQ